VTATLERPDVSPDRDGGGRRPPGLRDGIELLQGDTRTAKAVRSVLLGIGFYIAVQLYFHLSINYLIAGISLGSLYGIVAVGLILIYRTNRIMNFAAAAIGAVPAILALLLDVQDHISYLVVAPIALIGGPLVAVLVDITIIRRFSRSPRLILSVVTLAVATGLAAIGFFVPIWLGARAGQISLVPTPWDRLVIKDAHGTPILTGNQVAALVSVIVLTIALALFLRYTRVGIALRASSENADRASLLGIPVRRVQTVAWGLAGLLSAVAIFVQSPLIGVPSNATLGFDTLLYALAAAVFARMEHMGKALVAGMAVGIIIFGSVAKNGDNNLASALMLVIILVVLLLQRRTTARALDADTSSWQTVKQFRPVPIELRGLPEVQLARTVLLTAVTAIAVAAPFVVPRADVALITVIALFAIVAVSMVVLTGWAGQISLGQFGLVGASAGVAGGMVAPHPLALFAAMAIGIAAGVIAAVVIGLPAIRIQGLYLAVTTLAFGYAIQNYFLNPRYFGKHLLPTGLSAHLSRPMLYERINLENDRTFYFVCLVFLAAAILMATWFRKNRSGRVLIAARDNQRAAPSYSINLVRTRLAAFAVSGAIAGMAGVLFAYAQHNVIPGTYSVNASVAIFLATVIGGLTSVPFAVVGAVGLEAVTLFGHRLDPVLGKNIASILPLLLLGPALIVQLYFYPGGTAEAMFQERDKFLRKVAKKHNILVPSLVADKRVETGEEEQSIVAQAEQRVEEVEAFDLTGEATVVCPVCGDVLPLAAAAQHPHLQVDGDGAGGAESGGGQGRLRRAREARR
jgi:branched-chain amino acid transport system permease protein